MTRRSGRGRRRGAREWFWKCLHKCPEFTITLATTHGRLSFSNKDQGVGRSLFISRQYEYDKIEKAIALAIRVGAIDPRNTGYLIDVGANVGTVCIPLIAMGVFSRALAFEPEPKNYRFLLENIRSNRLQELIRAFDCGLSSVNGEMELELSARNSGDHRIRTGSPTSGLEQYRESSRAVISIQVRRLDSIIGTVAIRPESIRLIWMDVQGHEKHVLEGAQDVIRSGVPVVSEFWPYGLARAGAAAGVFGDCIVSNFDWFYDLAEESPRKQATAEVGRLFERYTDVKSFTDLLLLPRSGRVGPSAAAGTSP